MKKLSLTLFIICILLSAKLFAQSDTLVSPDAEMITPAGKTVDAAFSIRTSGSQTVPDPTFRFRFPGLREEYLERSRRQKRTGWILLGTGVALIGTGIAVASANDEDAIVAGVSLVLIGGPGLITSLISIPFFVASARSKRKAESFSSSVELLQSPVAIQNGVGYKSYPGIKLKMSF